MSITRFSVGSAPYRKTFWGNILDSVRVLPSCWCSPGKGAQIADHLPWHRSSGCFTGRSAPGRQRATAMGLVRSSLFVPCSAGSKEILLLQLVSPEKRLLSYQRVSRNGVVPV